MIRKTLGFCLATTVALSVAIAGEVKPPSTNLSAAEIVDRNVAARGGLQAWRAVHTMEMEGKLGVGGNRRATIPVPLPDQKGVRQALPSRPFEEVQLPFILELKRNRKMRLEVKFNGQTAIQVFDGLNGWKLRPFLNRLEVEPYTPEEMKNSSMQADLDGPLVDYAAKGTRVELIGEEKVADRNTYKLKLILKNGESMQVWIDAETFLETKIEGQPRRLDGIYHPVEVYYRDYRPVNGLQMPFRMETKVLPAAQGAKGMKEAGVPTEEIVVEKVVVNPELEESLFSKPRVTTPVSSKRK
jgi:hypothetical protein